MERWVPVPGFEKSHIVSDYGRVRSLPRQHTTQNRWGPMHRTVEGRDVTGYLDKDGYVSVRLQDNGRRLAFRLSRLVLHAFDRPPKDGEEACHQDHDKSNNRLSNLEWGTRQTNEDQKTAAGRRPRVTIQPVLSPEKAAEIRERHSNGESQSAIARDMGCSVSSVHLVVRGKSW